MLNHGINENFNMLRKYLKHCCDTVLSADVEFVHNPAKTYF